MKKDRLAIMKFCPYCGSSSLKFVGMVPRCLTCRAVFHLMFSRWTRKSPTPDSKTPHTKVTGRPGHKE